MDEILSQGHFQKFSGFSTCIVAVSSWPKLSLKSRDKNRQPCLLIIFLSLDFSHLI
ncbi:hypothetical protein BVC80_1769g46 [Macleaya cordata]|uniref:Uncharacterized protein n=1 Tax=Macleaya cordata TaxID=56857 RepID=A0A200QTK5_MACCD|nr:hypothetical protein BVC80_1769g46 [Macleaya cordata]